MPRKNHHPRHARKASAEGRGRSHSHRKTPQLPPMTADQIYRVCAGYAWQLVASGLASPMILGRGTQIPKELDR